MHVAIHFGTRSWMLRVGRLSFVPPVYFALTELNPFISGGDAWLPKEDRRKFPADRPFICQITSFSVVCGFDAIPRCTRQTNSG